MQEYKGYKTQMHYDPDDKVFFGKIEGIQSSITFHSEDQEGFEKEFHVAVDHFLEVARANDLSFL